MSCIIVQKATPPGCEPLTCERDLGDCPVANVPLRDLLRDRVAGLEPSPLPVFVRGDAWIAEDLLAELTSALCPTALTDEAGVPLAWSGGTEAGPETDTVDLDTDEDSFIVRFSWDVLRINEIVIGSFRESRVDGEVSPQAVVQGVLHLGAGSRVLPGVYVEGNVVIGRDCKVGPNCYLRGNTSIGDGCHVGQSVEIKNSLLMSGVSIGHLSYCGDSIIGEGVNFGAGTITANFRHDGNNHRSLIGGQLIDTGRRKFGSVVGDGVHTGIHTSIYPGRKLWPHTFTRPGAIVQHDLRV